MTINSLLTRSPNSSRPKSDLRSPTSILFRKGIAIGLIRVVSLLLLDTMSISLAWQFAILHGSKPESHWTVPSDSFSFLIIAIGISVIAAEGLYKAGKHRHNYLGLIKAISLLSLLLLLIVFLNSPNHYLSQSIFLLFWLFSTLFICTCRITLNLFIAWLRMRGAIRRPVFLISDNLHQEKSMQLIKQQNCYNILGIADPSCLDIDNREATFDTLRRLNVAEAFVSWDAIKSRLYLCWCFQTIGITLRILPTELDFSLPRAEFGSIGEISSPMIRAPIIIGSGYWVKRCFDFGFATLLLLFLLPLYLLIALLIKLDSPGPIFFCQTRIGLHCQQFQVWKFRTMVANADKLQTILEAKNEMKDGVLFKMKEDPRVTRIGKFLRCYSLDELPQLFNVLLGEMSIVGPRPLPARDVQRFEGRHFIRQEVLPGITGLWQVSGRSEIDNFDDAVNLDIAYICNWSLQLDLKIILQTVKVVLQRTGAY